MMVFCNNRSRFLVWAFALAVAAHPVFLYSQDRGSAEVSESQRFQVLLRAEDFSAAEQLALESPDVATGDALMLPWLKLKQGKVDDGIALIKLRITEATEDRDSLACSALQVVADASLENALSLGHEWLDDSRLSDIHQRLELIMARLYLRNKQPEVALPIIDKQIEHADASESLKDVIFALVLYLYQAGEPKEALRYLEEMRSRFPETKLEPGYQLQWAHIATAAGQPLPALKTLDRLTSDYPDYFRSNEVLFRISKGLAYEKIGDLDSATGEFTAAVDLSRSDPPQADIAKAKLKEFAQREESVKLAAAARAAASEDLRPPMIRHTSLWSRLIVLVNGGVVAALFIWWVYKRGWLASAGPRHG